MNPFMIVSQKLVGFFVTVLLLFFLLDKKKLIETEFFFFLSLQFIFQTLFLNPLYIENIFEKLF